MRSSQALSALTEAFPPEEVVRPAKWSPVERRLGVALPDDFKALCDIYGSQLIGGTFELFSPQAQRKDLRFPEAALAEVAMLRQEHELQIGTDPPGFTPIPDYRPWKFFEFKRGGLLPWARDASLIYFFNIDPGREPDTWEIVGPDPESSRTHVFEERSAVDVLRRLLRQV